MVSESELDSDSISLTAQKIKVTPELVNNVASKLHDADLAIGARFRALFTLRNLGGKLAIDAMAKCTSAVPPAAFCSPFLLIRIKIKHIKKRSERGQLCSFET